jgi:hypothetical protein
MALRRLLFILALVVVGCGTNVAALEEAPRPDTFEGGPWAVEFELDLEPGFWEVGHHRYQIWLECEALGPRQWSQHNFEADQSSEIIEDDLYVRLYGLSLHKTGPTGIKHINTEQPTIAVVTVLGLARETATVASEECVAELRLEDGRVIDILPRPPFRV